MAKFINERRPAAGGKVQRSTSVQRRKDITLAEALDYFVEAKEAEGRRPRTVKEYRQHIEYLGRYLGGSDAKLSALTTSKVRQYIKYLLTEKPRYEGVDKREGAPGLSPTTVNIRLRTLRTMARFWYEEGYAAEDFMKPIKNVTQDEEETLKGFTDEEVDRLYNHFDDRYFAQWRDKVLVTLLLDTGLRINEAVSLSAINVDFAVNTLRVPSTIAKNRKYRDVPMSRDVTKMLEQFYEESQQYFGAHEHIFTNAYGDPLSADAVRRRFHRIKDELGLERMHPHMFRHTFARNYLLNGGDVFSLQRILDHASITTTRKYVTFDMEQIREQHRKYSPVRRLFKKK